MRPSVCWRNIRWMRRYACRCETLVAMAFASSCYLLFVKWREGKTSPASSDTLHKLQNSLQYTRLTQMWQQYSRVFAATSNLPSPAPVKHEEDKESPGGVLEQPDQPPDDKVNMTNAQWFETGFLQRTDESTEHGPWSYKRGNIAVYALKGRRPTMEDRFSIVDDQANSDQRFLGFAIYDGHGGPFLANYAERHILPSVIRSFLSASNGGASTPVNISQVLVDEIVKNDEIAMKLGGLGQDLSGSTALIGVLHSNKLYIANVGDCRAVASKAGTLDEALQITMDHKPNQDRELERIKAAGGWVAFAGVWRVGGILAVSRALGDAYLKKFGWLTAAPDVFVIDLKRFPIRYMIMASDGLWDVFTSQEAIDFVSPYIDTENLFGAKQLAEKAVKKGSTDNVTVMIIKFVTPGG